MWKSLGLKTVAAPGTAVAVSSTSYPCQTLFFQQVSTNTGVLKILDSSTSSTAHILAVIPAPTLVAGVCTVLPYASVTIPSAPGALNAKDFWIDADVAGNGCQVSAVR